MISKMLSSLIVCALLIVSPAKAAVLWAGGENVDFPNGGSVCTYAGSSYRSGYARHSISGCGTIASSNAFTAAPVTSAWLSARIYAGYYGSDKFIGLGRSGTSSSLWIGCDSATKYALWKYDGTTWTKLITETGSSVGYGEVAKLDLQVTGYGASATVNLYLNGQSSPLITYTGNVLAGAATDLDNVSILGRSSWASVSEIIVADTDTRNLSLVTLAPNAAGDTTEWTGAYTNINPTTINDASTISTAIAGQTFQANLLPLPAGNFSILGIRLAARSVATGAGIGSLALGVKTNATVNVPAATAVSTIWETVETMYLNNPVTAVPWSMSEVNALQINFASGN